MWGFQKVDAFLTPSYVKEESLAADHIAIAKIGVYAPLTFVQSTNPDDFLEPLQNGVTHYPSALPGEKGTAIILGHSAPFAWLGNEYDGIFSNLKDLEQGDLVTVAVHGKSHTYRVSEKLFLKRGQDIPQELLQSDRSRLLLLSCWPPGINNKRIMVQAELSSVQAEII